jgi:hypothetical protein
LLQHLGATNPNAGKDEEELQRVVVAVQVMVRVVVAEASVGDPSCTAMCSLRSKCAAHLMVVAAVVRVGRRSEKTPTRGTCKHRTCGQRLCTHLFPTALVRVHVLGQEEQGMVQGRGLRRKMGVTLTK